MINRIDAVVLWVDGNDKQWFSDAKKYCKDNRNLKPERFRDWGTLKYWFRSIEKNASWFSKIHFVTCGHIPEWLNTDDPKINVVKHSDFIPEKFLPTFNSNAIELNLHRIDDLAERFVLFNDDVFLMKKTKPTDFFIGNKTRDVLIESPIIPTDDIFTQTMYNNIATLNKHYKKKDVMKSIKKYHSLKYGKFMISSRVESHHDGFVGFYNQHITTPFLKSYFDFLWKMEPGLCEITSSNKFRSKDDITQYLVRYLQLVEGRFVPRKVGFGRSYEMRNGVSAEKLKVLNNSVICLNDGEIKDEYESTRRLLIDFFEKKFNSKSRFEL